MNPTNGSVWTLEDGKDGTPVSLYLFFFFFKKKKRSSQHMLITLLWPSCFTDYGGEDRSRLAGQAAVEIGGGAPELNTTYTRR